MAMVYTERTFTMIKPDAVRNGFIGPILQKITQSGFKVIAMKMTQMSRRDARIFYGEHKGKEFFQHLVEYMVSGPIIAIVLEKTNAIKDYRDLIGQTDPKKAAPGTIRAMYGVNGMENAVHAADSAESALREISFQFAGREIYPDDEKPMLG